MRQRKVKNKAMVLQRAPALHLFYCRFMAEKLCYAIKDQLAKSHTAAAEEI